MLCFSTHACDFSQRVPPSIRRLVRPWLESAALIGLRLDRASGEPKWSTTQPFSDRRHTRSGTDGANDDKDAHDRDKPHSLYPEYPCRDHDGQDYGANNEPIEVHPPGEQATQHCGSVWHTGSPLGPTENAWWSERNPFAPRASPGCLIRYGHPRSDRHTEQRP